MSNNFELYINDNYIYKKINFLKTEDPAAPPYHGTVDIKAGNSLNNLTSLLHAENISTSGKMQYDRSHTENMNNFLSGTIYKNKYNQIKNNVPKINFGYLGDIARGYLGF